MPDITEIETPLERAEHMAKGWRTILHVPGDTSDRVVTNYEKSIRKVWAERLRIKAEEQDTPAASVTYKNAANDIDPDVP